ncbi:MAG: hypothetical protein Q4A09_01320 [Capnocytophaga felis]|nr:hypothetical protein [Capnocytophaga felis]
MFLPQIIWFGHPSATMIGAFFESDLQESKEFIQSLPLYSYVISVIYFLFGLYILYLGKKKTIVRTKKHIFLTILLVVVSLGLTLLRPLEKNSEGEPFYWAYSRTAIIGFYGEIFKNIEEYSILKAELEKGIADKPTWEINAVESSFNDYVLVIGESVRRDYMSFYGFPVGNSLFLKSVNGTVVEGYTVAAPNTSSSLLRMFVWQQNEAFLYANFHFLDGYAHWLRIKEKMLDPAYDFLSEKTDSLKVFNYFENVPYETLTDDEVIRF